MRTNRAQPTDTPADIRGMAGSPRATWQMRDASDQLLRDIGLSRSELTTITALRSSHHP